MVLGYDRGHVLDVVAVLCQARLVETVNPVPNALEVDLRGFPLRNRVVRVQRAPLATATTWHEMRVIPTRPFDRRIDLLVDRVFARVLEQREALAVEQARS